MKSSKNKKAKILCNHKGFGFLCFLMKLPLSRNPLYQQDFGFLLFSYEDFMSVSCFSKTIAHDLHDEKKERCRAGKTERKICLGYPDAIPQESGNRAVITYQRAELSFCIPEK